jgi:hypothetical protein
MRKFSLIAGVVVSTLATVRGNSHSTLRLKRTTCINRGDALTKRVILFFLLAAGPVHAQTALTVNTHWADGVKCSCTITVKQINADGSTTQVFQAVTDYSGHLSTTINLQVQGVYSFSVSSNAYGIPLLSQAFSTGLVTASPLKSATLNFVFARPSVNGQPIGCCALPANYTAPSLADGTSVQFGI